MESGEQNFIETNFFDLDNIYNKNSSDYKELERKLSTGESSKLIITFSPNCQSVLEKIKIIKEKINNSNVVLHGIEYDCKKQYIEDENEIKNMQSIAQLCQDNGYKFNIYFDNHTYSTFDKFSIAKTEVDNFANILNQFSREHNLSVAEKFMLVYRYVSNRIYNEDEHFYNDEMRNWVGVLTSDKIICSGFASLLQCVCDKVFDENELKCFTQGCEVYQKGTDNWVGGHANNLIVINDEKWGFKGVYYCDACWDSKKQINKNDSSVAYFMLPINSIFKHNKYDFDFDNNLPIYDKFRVKNKKSIIFYREHELTKFLLEKFGCKAYEEAKSNFDIKGKKQKIIEKRDKKSDKIKKQLENFFNKIENSDILTAFDLPRTMYEKYPYLEQFNEFVFKLKLKDFEKPETITEIKKYIKFCEEHKKEFDKAYKKAKSLGINIFEPFKEKIEYFVLRNEQREYSIYDLERKLEQKFEKEYQAQVRNIIETNQNYIISNSLTEEFMLSALTKVAMFEGKSKSQDIQWAQERLEITEQISKDIFYENSNNCVSVDEFAQI